MNSEEWMNTVRSLTKSQKIYKEDSELKNTTEKKIHQIGINRLDDTEEWICKLEVTVGKITQAEQKKKKSEDRLLRDLQDNIKCINICMIEVYQENKEAKNILEDKGSAPLNWFFKKY